MINPKKFLFNLHSLLAHVPSKQGIPNPLPHRSCAAAMVQRSGPTLTSGGRSELQIQRPGNKGLLLPTYHSPDPTIEVVQSISNMPR